MFIIRSLSQNYIVDNDVSRRVLELFATNWKLTRCRFMLDVLQFFWEVLYSQTWRHWQYLTSLNSFSLGGIYWRIVVDLLEEQLLFPVGPLWQCLETSPGDHGNQLESPQGQGCGAWHGHAGCHGIRQTPPGNGNMKNDWMCRKAPGKFQHHEHSRTNSFGAAADRMRCLLMRQPQLLGMRCSSDLIFVSGFEPILPPRKLRRITCTKLNKLIHAPFTFRAFVDIVKEVWIPMDSLMPLTSLPWQELDPVQAQALHSPALSTTKYDWHWKPLPYWFLTAFRKNVTLRISRHLATLVALWRHLATLHNFAGVSCSHCSSNAK